MNLLRRYFLFWSNRRLHIQLIVVSALLLAVTIFVTTILNIREQTATALDSLRNEALALSRNIVVTGAYHALTDQYDALEELLISSARFPAVRQLKVVDVKGRPLSHVKKPAGGEPVAHYALERESLPQDWLSNPRIDVLRTHSGIKVLQPMMTSSLLGGLIAEFSLESLENTIDKILFDNIVTGLLALTIDIAVLILILHPSLSTLRTATNFAEKLKDKNGETIRVPPTSRETNNLVSALNRAARDLHEQQSIIEKDAQHIKQTAGALQAANKQLEEKVDALESFSYSVSHDLRSPLRSIDGFSQILLEDYEHSLDSQGRNHLMKIRSASQRMAQLIDDILSLSRIDRHRIEFQEIDMSRLAKETMGRLLITQTGRKIRTQVQAGLHTSGDERLLGIVFDNLFSNSLKYTRHSDDPYIEFGTTMERGQAVWYVRDNGVGFNRQYADKIFEVFHRLHRDDEYEGTGIGLATVKRIVTRHNGKIWADSTPGQGTTIYFTLNPDHQVSAA